MLTYLVEDHNRDVSDNLTISDLLSRNATYNLSIADIMAIIDAGLSTDITSIALGKLLLTLSNINKEHLMQKNENEEQLTQKDENKEKLIIENK
jgi:hypothetical protein